MIFTVERAALSDAVSKLSRVVANKSTMPVLEGILLSAEQGKVTLAAYNLEMGMKKEIYCHCEAAGDIVISARLLGDILRRMKGVQVEIAADEKLQCKISCEGAVFDIMGMAATDFPEMPSATEGVSVSVDSKLFADMVRTTIFAVAQVEGTRPILTGLDFEVENGYLQVVGIDGCRLGIRKEKIDCDKTIQFIASGKAIGEAVKLIGEETDKIELLVGKRLLMMNIDGYLFISRLMEGEFVNYRKTIPTEHTQSITVNVHDLIDIIERVSLLINDFLTSPIRCYFDSEGVTFHCITSMGRATERYVAAMEGADFEIGMNSRLLLEALKAVSDSAVKIQFNGPNVGVVIRPIDDNQDDYFYMVMPMRLKNG